MLAEKKAASADAAFRSLVQTLRLVHAHLSLVDCSVQMLDRLPAMAVEVALGVLPDDAWRFASPRSLLHARVRRHRCRGGCRRAGWSCRREPGPPAPLDQPPPPGRPRANRSIAVIKSVKNPIFFMRFLLVRIPARTPPPKSDGHGTAYARRTTATPAQYSRAPATFPGA